jgi:FUS-interacting serine-arginine-rich protein 1
MSRNADNDDDEEEEYSRSRSRDGRRRGRSYSPPVRRRSRSRSPERRSRHHRDRSDSPPPPDMNRRGGDRGGRYRGDYDDDRPYPPRGPPPPHFRDPYPPPRGPPPPPHRRGYNDYPPPHDPYYDDRRGGDGYRGRDGPPPHFRDGPPPHADRFGDRPGPPPGRRGERRRDEGPPGVSLLIRNISPDITSQDLQQAFGRIGDLRDVYIPRDYHSQQPKGFAFIEYATAERAMEARDEMNHFVIKGREIEVVFAQERRKTPNEMRGRVVNQQNHRVEDVRKERSSSFERHRQQQTNGKDDKKKGADDDEESPSQED